MTLFDHQRPVCGPAAFKGRVTTVRSIISGIERGRSFLLCGGPKTGKSSVIAQVSYQLELAWTRQPDAPKTVPIHFDLQARAQSRGGRWLSELWSELVSAVLSSRVSGGQQPVRPPEAQIPRAKDPWNAFADAANELWERLAGTSGWCRYALFLEHGDFLVQRPQSEMRQEVERLAAFDGIGAPMALVLTSSRRLREHLLQPRSRLGNLRPLFLGNFNQSEAQALVRSANCQVPDDWTDRLFAVTGRHPFLLQRLLYEAQSRGFDTPVDELVEVVQPDAHALFEAIWQELDMGRNVAFRGAYAAPEHALMQYILSGENRVELRRAERELGIRPLKEFAELLCYLGVVERVLLGNQTVYRAPNELWNQWYSERALG